MYRVFSSPTFTHDLPASVDLYIPSAREVQCSLGTAVHDSPMPA